MDFILNYSHEFLSFLIDWIQEHPYSIIGTIAAWLVITTIIDIKNRIAATGDYRRDFVKAHPGRRRIGRKGYWYRCKNCGKWCARPGKEQATISENQKMEVDHILPWSKGGTDAIWNLQPLCKPCNRSKSNNHDAVDKVKVAINTIIHPVDSIIGVFIRKSFRQNKVLKKLGINKRK